MSKINICFCSDKKLIDYIPVVINSIISKNKKHEIAVHLIHNIQNRSRIDKLNKWVSHFDNFSFQEYFKKWSREYTGLDHVSEATMLRLFIPELINEDKILYLDIDIIVNLDLMEIYKIDTKDIGIALKPCPSDKVVDNISIIRYKNKKLSGNCGIIMMNLEVLRKNKFTQTCLELHKKNDDKHDQWIINEYCQGHYIELEPRFNVYHRRDSHLMEQHEDYILHYNEHVKPYHTTRDCGKYQYLWDEQYKKLQPKTIKLEFNE